MQRPMHPPDLNPIEHAWDTLGRHISENSYSPNRARAKHRLETETGKNFLKTS